MVEAGEEKKKEEKENNKGKILILSSVTANYITQNLYIVLFRPVRSTMRQGSLI